MNTINMLSNEQIQEKSKYLAYEIAQRMDEMNTDVDTAMTVFGYAVAMVLKTGADIHKQSYSEEASCFGRFIAKIMN